MRVLQIVQQPQRRGAEVFAHDLTGYLLRSGHDVRTVYLYASPGRKDVPVREGDWKLDADRTHASERILAANPAVIRQLRRIAKDFGPDVVQANGARTLKYGSAIRRTGDFGLVYRSIGDPAVWVSGWARKTLYRRMIMPRVDGVAAVSDNTLRGLRSLYDLSGKVVEVIPRGIDPKRLAPRVATDELRLQLGSGRDQPVVAFVGSLTSEKRPDRLARVFARLAASVPDARLWIVGDGPCSADVRRRFEDADLSSRVSFVGDTDDVGSYLAAADVLLLTSDTEGLPGVVLEAAALGTPAVSTDVGGVADAIAHGSNGLLLPAADEDGLADAVRSLIADRNLLSRLGAAARTSFERDFAIEAVGRRYEDLYRRVLGPSRG